MASVETVTWRDNGPGSKTMQIDYTAHTDGTVQDVTLVAARYGVLGWFLYRARAWPLSGGTAPDAANVSVKDENGYDFLESNGNNLIHATNPEACPPYMNGTPCLQQVLGDLTVAVASQATNGAEFCVALDFMQ